MSAIPEAKIEALARGLAKARGLDPDRVAYRGVPLPLDGRGYVPVTDQVTVWVLFREDAFTALAVASELAL